MRKEVLFSLIGLAIILSVYFIFFASTEKEKEKPVYTKPETKNFCSTIKFEPLKNICLKVASKSINACDDEKEYSQLCHELLVELINTSQETCKNIKDKYGRFLCYKKLAIKTKNANFCMNNLDCYKELAISSGDKKFCEYLDEYEKLKCFALVLNDRSYCKEISEEFERKVCFGGLPESIKDCKDFDYYDTDCVIKLANKTKNLSICYSFTGDEEILKWKCLVIVKDDVKVCEDAKGFFADVCRIYYLKNHLKEVLR